MSLQHVPVPACYLDVRVTTQKLTLFACRSMGWVWRRVGGSAAVTLHESSCQSRAAAAASSSAPGASSHARLTATSVLSAQATCTIGGTRTNPLRTLTATTKHGPGYQGTRQLKVCWLLIVLREAPHHVPPWTTLDGLRQAMRAIMAGKPSHPRTLLLDPERCRRLPQLHKACAAVDVAAVVAALPMAASIGDATPDGRTALHALAAGCRGRCRPPRAVRSPPRWCRRGCRWALGFGGRSEAGRLACNLCM